MALCRSSLLPPEPRCQGGISRTSPALVRVCASTRASLERPATAKGSRMQAAAETARIMVDAEGAPLAGGDAEIFVPT